MPVRVLVVGGGGREHALVRGLSADPSVTTVLCAPGNAGTAAQAERLPLDVGDPAAVADAAQRAAADLVVVGPEAPLVAGAADAVRARGVACVGPSAAAARLEGSKAFAKDVMAAAGVATARAVVAASAEEVAAALDAFGPPYVVKDDGLAAGKGVVVTSDREVAAAHAARCGRVVVEDYLDGPEVSVFVLCDGTADGVVPLLPAQDHKRLGDGDAGPNTGGMGAYAPVPWAPTDLARRVVDDVARPVLAEMTRRGTPFSGVLYCGLALTGHGVQVVEFNVRLGDPEAQAVLALLDSPLGELMAAVAHGRLARHPPLRWADGAAVTVVLAAPGYPDAPVTGGEVTGLAEAADAAPPGTDVTVLHAGTARTGDAVRASGGRVLSVTGTGPDLGAARAAAYAGLDRLHLPGGQARRDVARVASAS